MSKSDTFGKKLPVQPELSLVADRYDRYIHCSPLPQQIKKKLQASRLLNLLSASIHNLLLTFVLQTKACQAQCCSRHSHVLITFINTLNKEKNGFVTAMFWKKNKPLCFQRKEEFSASDFIQLPAGPWSLCSHVHSDHLA